MKEIIDPILEFGAEILNFFYSVIPNFAIAIMLMTLLVLAVTSPLTLKGTRGMIKLQLLQPELKRIQNQHRDDRTKMNEEMMRFYQENEVNPVGGCLPLLVQAPIFLLLYNVIRGLTRVGADGTFDPRYLSPDSELYRALDSRTEMVSFGLDLARSTSDAIGASIGTGLPYLVLIGVMTAAQYFQQKQISARNPDGSAAMPQQKILLRVMPAFFAVISLNFAAALVVYWTTSNIARIGLQAYITRSLYGHEDSLGAQATKVSNDARKAKDADKTASKPTDRGKGAASKAKPATEKSAKGDNGQGGSAGEIASRRVTPSKASTSSSRQQPSSKKKKRKRR